MWYLIVSIPDLCNLTYFVFCDISEDFDLVWHASLLRKLDAAGVTEKLLNWFKNYLLDRRQCVIFPGVNSDWSKYLLVLHMVLYWAHSFFCCFFINDTVNEIGSCTRLFADDTSLFIIVNDPVASAEQLNINFILEKAGCRINIMRKFKFKVDRKSLEIIYTAYIRPTLEY